MRFLLISMIAVCTLTLGIGLIAQDNPPETLPLESEEPAASSEVQEQPATSDAVSEEPVVPSEVNIEEINAFNDWYISQIELLKQIEDLDHAQVEHMIQVIEKQRAELSRIEDIDIKELRRKYKYNERKSRLEKYNQEINEDVSLKVAILGSSRGDQFDEIGFNDTVLELLFKKIKENAPQAVFFTGDLVYGLQHAADVHEARKLTLSRDRKGILGISEPVNQGVYTEEGFKTRLTEFLKVLHSSLGKEIPFYPLVGEHAALEANSQDVFMNQFGIKNQVTLESHQLVYTVAVGQAFFVLISTDYYDPVKKQLITKTITEPVLKWLDQELQEKSKQYKYLFVLGNDPAFSTTANLGVYKGLDQNKQMRNKFWSILAKNHVLAYFCAQDLIYDRSYRYGVWQIISGGAGSYPDHTDDEDPEDEFFHYVLLMVPTKENSSPRIKVIDVLGNVADEINLANRLPAVFDLRIKGNRTEITTDVQELPIEQLKTFPAKADAIKK